MVPPPDVDVILVAPKGFERTVRSNTPSCAGMDTAPARLLEAIKNVVKEKLKSLDAGKMGYATDEVGDLVVGYLI